MIKKTRGFSLIEMLIVTGVITLLGSATIPNYVAYRQKLLVSSEAEKITAFLRDGVSRAKSQQDGVTWAIEFKNATSSPDYYQLRSGGAGGTPVSTTYLNPGVEFTATTTDMLVDFSGGPNLQILSTADSVIEVGLQTLDGRFTDLVSMDAFGRVARTSLQAECEPVVNGGWSVTWVNSGNCGQYQACKQKQIKYCNNPTPTCGGTACPAEQGEQYIDCGVVNGVWTDWSTCSACSQSRTCTNPAPACGGTNCSGNSTQTCGVVNGGWSAWGACVDSLQTRTCTNPTPACGGANCSGLDGGNATRACVLCDPVNGGWSAWGTCTNCSQSRTCTNPTPDCGGADCIGSSTQACGTQDCVMSSWGSCSAYCACDYSGTQTRTVVTPAACGGAACGATSQACSGYAPNVNCGYSGWSACSVSCANEMGEKTRSITQYPECCGTACGATSQSCSGSLPTVNCGGYSTWSACSSTCASISGVKGRSNTIDPQCGGTACVLIQACVGTLPDVNCTWSAWSACSVSCANESGTKTRYHTQEAQCNGTNCSGGSSLACSGSLPTLNCVWSAWSPTCAPYPNCSTPISQSRYYTQSAQCGGTACTGLSSRSISCPC
jgi:prepilin-type N-terminal cleavage/methylation domain-containing protein